MSDGTSPWFSAAGECVAEDGAFVLAKDGAAWRRDVTFAPSEAGARVAFLRKFPFYCDYKGGEIKLLIYDVPRKKVVIQGMLSSFSV